MPVSISIWRAQIGAFLGQMVSLFRDNFKVSGILRVYLLIISFCTYFFDLLNNWDNFIFLGFCKKNSKTSCGIVKSLIEYKAALLYLEFFLLIFYSQILLLSGDIEENPGPKNGSWSNFSFCFWNLNSIPANNFCKISLIEAYNSQHKFDIICLSETFLNSSYRSDDSDLHINGYKLIRADHPSDNKRGGVALYCKDYLPLRICDTSYIDEFLLLEMNFDNKKCFLISLYRSPSQSFDEFNDFCLKFDKTLEYVFNQNPQLVFVVGDFNARSDSWWPNDVNTIEGTQIEALTSLYGLHQIISEPTHITPYSLSCIDLLFTNQPNMVLNSGVHPSLYEKCHHQIVFAKINLKIDFPPPYERILWDYNKADNTMINQCIQQFNWDIAFLGKSIEEQVKIFNDTVLNIFSNFVPFKTVTFDDKDPPWITDHIKTKLVLKNTLYRKYIMNGKKSQDLAVLENTRKYTSDLIIKSRKDYYMNLGSKLNDPLLAKKSYWSIVKTLFNGKKIPVIPPIYSDNQVVTDFKTKANIFNDHFSNQCSVIPNNSTLPSNYLPLTNDQLTTLDIKEEDILKVIRNLKSNKAHGWDTISIRMLKICDVSITKPLTFLFKNCLSECVFPEIWKKANVVPIFKKGSRQDFKNYRPISLLPICGKIFERIIFNSIFNFIEERKLLSQNQSGFKPQDSCVHQLLSITNSIYSSFDCNPSLEVRGVFLDISKAFDKVWHDGLLLKIKSFGITGKLLKLMQSFLSNRFQRVVLNGQYSDWKNISAGVPQGSILGPLLFLIYINDLPNELQSDVKLFADDTCLFSVIKDKIDSANELNSDLEKISNWAVQWKMSFNPDPSKQATELLFSRKRIQENHPDLRFNNTVVSRVTNQKHLGVLLDSKLNFSEHIKQAIGKSIKGLNVIRKLNHYLPRKTLITVYKSFIRPHLDYGDIIYDQPSNSTFSNKIESIQYNCALAITGAIKGTSKEKLYQELGLEYLSKRRWFRRLSYFYRIKNSKLPNYLFQLIPTIPHNYPTRNVNIRPLRCRTNFYCDSFFPYSIKEWNSIDPAIRNITSYAIFRKNLLKLIRPSPNSLYGIHDPLGVKLLTRIRLGLSHLREHKFRHNFQDTVNPLCTCSLEIEDTNHFFLRCQNFSISRTTLLDELNIIEPSLILLNQNEFVKSILFGNPSFSSESNRKILECTINYLKNTKRFDGALL